MHNDYGQRTLLAQSAGLTSDWSLKRSPIVWVHGWKPSTHNIDVDMIIGESAETSNLEGMTYFVGRNDQETSLREAGLLDEIHAIGLPFAYALKYHGAQEDRRHGSLAVMPANHGDLKLDGELLELEKNYIECLVGDGQLEAPKCHVILNCDDIRRGRGSLWTQYGFQVLEGACLHSVNSLQRVVRLLCSFDTITTNGFGSHIAYAASAGCKISVFGPRPPIRLSDLYHYESFRRRPELAPIMIELEENAIPELVFEREGFMVRPQEATRATDWGKKEIGFDNVLEPRALRELIMSVNSMEHRWMRFKRSKENLKRRRNEFVTIASAKPSLTRVTQKTISSGIGNFFSFIRKKQTFQVVSALGHQQTLRRRSTDLSVFRRFFEERELDGFDFGSIETILDLGAYIGFSTNYFLEKFPEANVVAVEPDLANFDLLQMNLPPEAKVKTVLAGVWPRNETISLIRGPDGFTSHKTVSALDGFELVQGQTVSSLIAGNGWSSVDLIKMAIQGTEYQVLAAIASDISQLCSVLLVKFHHQLARKNELDALLKQITTERNVTVTQVGEFTVFDFRPPISKRGQGIQSQ